MDWKSAKSIYEFNAADIDGNEVSLQKYRGNVVLIVNVASNCGFTKSNYKQLNELHEKYAENGLAILAFPCNQFLGQEPGCEADIKEFAKKNNIAFDMFSKVNVNGSNAHPLYNYLKQQKGGFLGSYIKWNFTKFLVDKNGVPTQRYAPNVEPKNIEADIKAML
ncbi:glutathione peroxidase-like isoform X2 [Leptotrombidium deliense]|uniref:Glutathione peroxidase n=1 Tax=Leptotrombidium deliense TaxID=299467 RepID=A0A443SUN5_9ACAR|nr:glutathione peroxidase-like isoform X2 [Leptotrombidium deliense]